VIGTYGGRQTVVPVSSIVLPVRFGQDRHRVDRLEFALGRAHCYRRVALEKLDRGISLMCRHHEVLRRDVLRKVDDPFRLAPEQADVRCGTKHGHGHRHCTALGTSRGFLADGDCVRLDFFQRAVTDQPAGGEHAVIQFRTGGRTGLRSRRTPVDFRTGSASWSVLSIQAATNSRSQETFDPSPSSTPVSTPFEPTARWMSPPILGVDSFDNLDTGSLQGISSLDPSVISSKDDGSVPGLYRVEVDQTKRRR